MKRAILEQLNDPDNSSFLVKKSAVKHFGSVWHYHPLTEIILITEGSGTGFIGDTICPFQPGIVSIIGPEMPHVWLNGKEFYEENSDLMARNIVIWFKDNFLGDTFKLIPEMKQVTDLMHLASRGIVFYGRTRKTLEKKILSIETLDQLQRVICLLEILDIMARSDEFKFLASPGYSLKYNEFTQAKVSKVFEYIMHHFTKELTLEEVASVVHLTPNAFCGFFRKCFRKTYKEFLNEVRIGHASKLLIDKGFTVSLAAFQSGYNNLTHFHRQFKIYNGITPGEYIRRYKREVVNANIQET